MLKLLNYPHPALRGTCKPVTALDESVRTSAARMIELMYKNEGLGLAAPQVGLDYQMIVINFDGDPKNKEMELVAINPVVVKASKTIEKDREGCLSFPGLYQDIRRPKAVTVQFYTLAGQLQEMTCADLPARIWQHEIDHLAGTLFIDKMGDIARKASKKWLEQYVEDFEDDKKAGRLPPDLPKML
jgi:peptide deformylase